MEHPRLKIPKARSEIVGCVIGTVILAVIVGFFTSLSIKNILNLEGVIQSAIWLLLVGGMIWGICHEKGAGKFLIRILGAFSANHFVESVTEDPNAREIRIGFHAFGRSFFYVRTAVERIKSVEWHTGQASYFAKRDMDDWHVVLWFDHNDPSQRMEGSRKCEHDLHIVGSSRSREVTEPFGLELVNFLREADVRLVKGKDECIYARESPETAEEIFQETQGPR